MPTEGCPDCPPLPAVRGCGLGPRWSELDSFLAQPMNPLPTEAANETHGSPWHNGINNCVRPVATTCAEGRPPGVFFSHQRYFEFPSKVYFKTAQAGIHTNGGLRDSHQRHGYALGEFAPGGLYHNTAGAPGFEGTTAGLVPRLHPNMPVQDENSVWTFDGTLPPKLLQARYGEPILFRHYNALPIDESANNGFGMHTITTHEHNGHNPAESDGFAHAFFFPGQYYDYHWPMVLAGHDRINVSASDPRAGTPDGNGGIRKIPGDWRETMSTHWFHDHMLDFTAQNVYKGNAAMMNYYSAIDRGNEAIDDGVNLRLPSGSALDWGNRDYDVNLLVADKAWDQNGQLYFNIFNTDGFLGDRMTVNWLYKPYFEVRARRYRFRILNGAVSRYFKLALVNEAGTRVPFYLVANDGNIMENAVKFPNSQSADLPEQGIAERYDIIVDFSSFAAGSKLYLVNLLEHENGKGPKQVISLASAFNGTYQGDPAVGKILEFRVQPYSGTDLSMNPADYVSGKKAMWQLPTFTPEELAHARHRTFEFGRSGGSDDKPWTIKTDGGEGLGADPSRVSAAPEEGSAEIWHIVNAGNGWAHPVHIHFEEAQILARDGQPPKVWEKGARKDMFRVGTFPDSAKQYDVAIRFREFMGTYVEHCHNTQHEDTAMLLRWDNQSPGQTIAIPSPEPGWEGVTYAATSLLPTAHTGDPTKPPVGVDNFNITIDQATYRSSDARWRVSGMTTYASGTRLRVRVGTSATGALIASPKVNADHSYDVNVIGSSVVPSANRVISVRPDPGTDFEVGIVTVK
jgi:FtsP/CotA-like multicopper oxidase with cupredoxin domain